MMSTLYLVYIQCYSKFAYLCDRHMHIFIKYLRPLTALVSFYQLSSWRQSHGGDGNRDNGPHRLESEATFSLLLPLYQVSPSKSYLEKQESCKGEGNSVCKFLVFPQLSSGGARILYARWAHIACLQIHSLPSVPAY